MKLIGSILIITLIFGSTAREAVALPKKQTLAQCEEQLEKASTLIRLGEEEQKNAAELTRDCAALKALNADLIAKNAELERLREAKEAEAAKSLERAQQSEAELKAAVTDLEKKLDACAKDGAGSWYGRWEVWAGAVAGLAAGLTIGWVAGEL